MKKDWIENLVVSKTMETVMNDKLMKDLSNRLFLLQKKENKVIPVLNKQLSQTAKSIENMLDAIQAGIFTESTKNRLDQLEEQKNQLEISLLQEQLQRPFLSKEQILFWLYKFRGTDTTDKAERQRLIDSFVNAIYLYDDKLVITFNYKDGAKTITLGEVNGSDLTGTGVPEKQGKKDIGHTNPVTMRLEGAFTVKSKSSFFVDIIGRSLHSEPSRTCNLQFHIE